MWNGLLNCYYRDKNSLKIWFSKKNCGGKQNV